MANSGKNGPDLQHFPRTFVPSATEKTRVVPFSSTYFGLCAMGGAIACGPTHALVTPMDMVKVNMQADPTKYKSITKGFSMIWRDQGLHGITKGVLPTFVGYSFQGAFKYGGYEYFKDKYSTMIGPENAKKYKDIVYVTASASGEFFADLMLCPFEAVKVRVQTQPTFARGMIDGLPKLISEEGFFALYRGIVPLWSRQIPYTIMKFYTFERTVESIYKNLVPYSKKECSKSFQLGISFGGGYIAGIFCTVASQPADNIVSLMNKKSGVTFGSAFKELGFLGSFTRGLPLRLIQIGTLTGVQWAIYDSIKVYFGLPTTGEDD